MAENLLSKVRARALHRIDVAFAKTGVSVNSIIGREAHLQFLENEALMKLIVYRYSKLFT